MPSTTEMYRKGRKFEWKIRDQLKAEGYYVIRSAGSRGQFDLIALHPGTRKMLCLQLKLGSKQYLTSQKNNYLDCSWVNGSFDCEFIMVERLSKKARPRKDLQ